MNGGLDRFALIELGERGRAPEHLTSGERDEGDAALRISLVGEFAAGRTTDDLGLRSERAQRVVDRHAIVIDGAEEQNCYGLAARDSGDELSNRIGSFALGAVCANDVTRHGRPPSAARNPSSPKCRAPTALSSRRRRRLSGCG